VALASPIIPAAAHSSRDCAQGVENQHTPISETENMACRPLVAKGARRALCLWPSTPSSAAAVLVDSAEMPMTVQSIPVCEACKMRLRSVPWWGWLLSAAVPVVILIVVAAVVSATVSDHVTLVNDGSRTLRLSGCSIDDSLDLDPGQSSSPIDVEGRTGCSVYAPEDQDARSWGALC